MNIITNPHTFVDGALTVPDAPGLGVELDEDSVEKLHQRWMDMPEMRVRDDVAAMRRFQPDWQKPAAPRW
ncbi:hypothetical protein ACFVYC_04890 [Pseudarthrobacter sp. NPDC058329]|uniref:hypothetical protein n=1 Tax=Pseudarthrobacter sp. NPDC058329 TaxID=3346448 RepID=UPI0036D92DAF